jgi:sugar lactone lactonase YvrE
MAAALGPAGAAPVKLRYVTAVYADAAGKPLQSPEGVACRAARLVVADTLGGRLVTFTVDGDTVTASGEIVLAQLPSPTRVRIDSKGDLVVLDGKLRRIARVSAAGAFTGYVDAPAGPSAFVPRGFALDRADALYTLDIAGGRVVVFDPAGKAVREIALPADRGSYSDIAVDGKGTLYVLDSVGRRVLAARKDQGAFAPLGSGFEGEADFPTSLVADDAGRLFVSDLDGGSILALGPDGKVLGRLSGPGWKPALLRAPSQLCLDGHGHLAVADRDNRRVQIFALSP